MKQYPSIIQKEIANVDVYAFDKLDGSNIRAEFTRKNGFIKFGSRHQMLDDQSGTILRHAIPLIKNKYTESFGKIIQDFGSNTKSIVGFFEFFGPNSFAGFHTENDLEKFDVVLFDIDAFKIGLLPPQEFLQVTKNVETAKLLYTGKPNQNFIDSVKNQQLEGMTFEGVVCKSRPLKKERQPLMFKIKSKAWIDKLKKEKTDQFDILL